MAVSLTRSPHRAARLALVLVMPLALLAAQPAAASSQSDWATASDIGVGALTAWSLGVPLVTGDTPGALQAGASLGAAAVVSQGLKMVIPEMRPDGSNDKSFPSGHASVAFAAAASIAERRGYPEGIAALAIAGLVATARVQADKHYWHDVVAGAGIGIASGLLLTHPHQRAGVAMVWGDAHSLGISYAGHF